MLQRNRNSRILKHAYFNQVTDFRGCFSAIILELRKLKWQVGVFISSAVCVCLCVFVYVCIPELLQIVMFLDVLRFAVIFFPTNFSWL